MMWHGKCYKPRGEDSYPIAKLEVTDEIDDPKEENKFRFGRNGDHLMCPFQCDLCHFRNIQKRNPVAESSKDVQLLVAIRRANLDAFWGRSEGTVAGNKSLVSQIIRIGQEDLGIEGNTIMPEMGPHPLEDNWGVGLAAVMLQKTLDPGMYGANVQFVTVRKLRSGFSNAWGASKHALTEGVMARDTMKTFVTTCPTFTLWFERFVAGMHSRMGDKKRQDLAITKKVMHALMKRVEVDYYDTFEDVRRRRYIVRAGFFFLAAYLGSLRGEEVPRIVRKALYQLNEEARHLEPPHCILPLYGRFKTEKGVPRCFIFRIAQLTKSGFNMGKWINRIMEEEKQSGTVYLFANANGAKEGGSVYEQYFYAKLKEVQKEEKGLIPRSLDVEEAYGIGRSFRRGSVTEAGNAPKGECDADDIRRNNRWRLEDGAGTKDPGLDMLQLYTDTLHSVGADLKFSTCL